MEFEETRDAQQAMQDMNEVEWMGRKMFIREVHFDLLARFSDTTLKMQGS